jgi:hypothetical protein
MAGVAVREQGGLGLPGPDGSVAVLERLGWVEQARRLQATDPAAAAALRKSQARATWGGIVPQVRKELGWGDRGGGRGGA